MKIILLAAGYGTRLGSLTKDRPKPMIEVGGKPIIEHILTRLSLYGLRDVIVNLHYLPGVITEYLGSRVLYYYEPRLLGHQGTIMALRNWLDGNSFMVINGDTVSDIDYSAMMRFHKENTITAYMEEWRSAGTWIYSSSYFDNHDLVVCPYRQDKSVWFDVGIPERLEAARRYFDEQKVVDSMPKM